MALKQSNKKGNIMKLDVDWAAMAKAAAKAWPGQGSGDLWPKAWPGQGSGDLWPFGSVTFGPRVR